MLSIWPNMDESTQNYREFRDRGLLLPGSNIYDPPPGGGLMARAWKRPKASIISAGSRSPASAQYSSYILDGSGRSMWFHSGVKVRQGGEALVLEGGLFPGRRGPGVQGALRQMVPVGGFPAGVPGTWDGLPEGTVALRQRGGALLRRAAAGQPAALPADALYLLPCGSELAGGCSPVYLAACAIGRTVPSRTNSGMRISGAAASIHCPPP